MAYAEETQTRYCDVVMKGGIASGVVYPLAAVELAKQHRFRNIGGTSAGAIAAAAVAAAEFGVRSTSNEAAYERLAKLPDQLGKSLTSLFQPSRRLRPLFELLLAAGGGWRARLGAVVRGFSLAMLGGALPGVALVLLAALLGGAAALRVAAGLAGLLLLVAGPCVAVVVDAALRLSELPGNYFGLCTGNDRGGGTASPPLTRWLSELIDELAGREDSKPLTFGDLWGLEEPDGERGVNLQMMTTNLSQGRPYSLPFEGGEDFWFDVDELRDLFPERVVEHMVFHAAPGSTRSADGRTLRRLPEPRHMPIVVAARMSLSFPGLISAVPLYAVNDATRAPGEVPERCWFSDGGIASNFPIHLFDAPIPRWPTFAIDLMPLSPGRTLSDEECENVWLPETNEDGIAEAWVGWEGGSDWGRLGAFAVSVFRTAQSWIDNRQMRGAGFRDRIAHVRLAKNEGGMNLQMEGPAIQRLAERGRCAARELAERFGPNPPAGTVLTWDNQRWLRYRTYMEVLEARGGEAVRGYRDATLGAPLDALFADPPAFGWRDAERRELARKATGDLLDQLEAWQKAEQPFAEDAPGPAPLPWSIPRV